MELREGLFLLVLLCSVSALSIGATADTTIDSDVVTDTDLTFVDDTVIVRGNITLWGTATLSLQNSTLLFDSIPGSRWRFVALRDNASMHALNSRLNALEEDDVYLLEGKTNGSVVLDGCVVTRGGYTPWLMPALSMGSALVSISDTTFEDCGFACRLERCIDVIVGNCSFARNLNSSLDLRTCADARVVDCRFDGTVDGPALRIDGCAGALVRGCSFDGDRCGVQSDGKSRDLRVVGCNFSRCIGPSVEVLSHHYDPGPVMEGCEFFECQRGVSAPMRGAGGGHWAAEDLRIVDCRFRFMTLAVHFAGTDWHVDGCDFDYCDSGVYAGYSGRLYVTRCEFRGCMYQCIHCSDDGILVDVEMNRFASGPAIGVSLINWQAARVMNNTFVGMEGCGVGVSNDDGLLVAENNTFLSCVKGMELYGSRAVSSTVFEDCVVGIRSVGCDLALASCAFRRNDRALACLDSNVTLVNTVLDGCEDMLCEHSRLEGAPGVVWGTTAVVLDRDAVAIVRDGRRLGGTSWSLNRSSTLDLFNCSLPVTYTLHDDMSRVRVWWPVEVVASRVSDGGGLAGLPVLLLDPWFEAVATGQTDGTGRTTSWDVLVSTTRAGGVVGSNPHRIVVIYRGREVARDVDVGGPCTFLVELDDVPPTVRIDSPTNGAWVGSPTIEVLGTAEDPGGIETMRVELDGLPAMELVPTVAWRFFLNLSEGSHRISVVACDPFSNEGRSEIRCTVDLYPPFLEVLDPSPGTVMNEGTVTVSGRTEPHTIVSCGDVGSVPDADGFFTLSFDVDREGPITVRVASTDMVGHVSSIDTEVIIDWTPPSVSLMEPSAARNTTNPTLTGSVSEVIRQLSLNGLDVPVDEQLRFGTMVALAEGWNTIDWICEDLAGNLASGQFTVLVDTLVNLTLEWPTEETTVVEGWIVVRGRTDADATVLEPVTGTSLRPSANGSFEMRLWSGEVGRGVLEVVATDPVGNLNTSRVGLEVVERPSSSSGEIGWPMLALLVLAASASALVTYRILGRGLDG